jgi:hypothetical protein
VQSVFLSAATADGGHVSSGVRVAGEDHYPVFRATASLGNVEIEVQNKPFVVHTRTEVEEAAVRLLLVALELTDMARTHGHIPPFRLPPVYVL